jgi:hypothetical protein
MCGAEPYRCLISGAPGEFPPTGALAALRPRPHTVHPVASISDPRPRLAYLRRLPARLMPTDGVLARAPDL